MVKDIWHKIEDGSFDKVGKRYEYAIEQNKNIPLEKGGVRIRIIKSKPTVKNITTRYDPHIEVSGDNNAYVPSYFGYSLKRLNNWKYVLFFDLIFIGAIVMLMDIFFPNLLISFPTINAPHLVSVSIKYGLFIFSTAFLLFFMIIPINIKYYNTYKLYKKLKKEGLNFGELL